MATDETNLGGPVREFPRTTGGFLDDLRRPKGPAGFETLCRRYWKPVYAFIRAGWAKTNEDAKDLTQDFFLWLREGDLLARYQRERAPFRQFLKGVLRRFIADQHKAAGRIKRGGDATFVKIPDDLPLPDLTAAEPGALFDQIWMAVVVRGAVEAVAARCAAEGRSELFRVFETHDLRGDGDLSYAEVGARLGLSESRVRDALASIRRDVRAEIRAELERQTSDPEALEEEWNAFRGA